jgi:hypothetical protein
MKKILLTIVCVIGLLENNSYARIGETLAQCEERYGKRITKEYSIRKHAVWMLHLPIIGNEIKRNGEVNLFGQTYSFFEKDKYIICVSFHDKIVETIRFMKREYEIEGNPDALTDEEISIFLEANKGDDDWVEQSRKNIWISRKRQNEASLMANVLSIKTKQFFDRFSKEKDEKNKVDSERKKEVLKKF